VEPLFIQWQRFAASHRSRLMLAHLRNNRVAWQRKLQQQQQTADVTSSSTVTSSPQPSNHSSRRHSLPTSRDAEEAGSRSRGYARRHSAPHAAVRALTVGGLTLLAELNECSTSPAAHSDAHFHFDQTAGSSTEPQTDPRQTAVSSSPSACLVYLRRLSLNTCSASAAQTTSSRRRSRSLVTPSCHLNNGDVHGNGVASSGHLGGVTSSSSSSRALPVRLMSGRLRATVH